MIIPLSKEQKEAFDGVSLVLIALINKYTLIRFVVEDGRITGIEV